MARIAGVDLPRDKRVDIALRYIYGIGPTRAYQIVEGAGVEGGTKVRDLSEDEVLHGKIPRNYLVPAFHAGAPRRSAVRPGRADAVDVAERGSTRLSRGRSTPAIRATRSPPRPSPGAACVGGCRADHADHAAPADDLATVAHLFPRRTDLHLLPPLLVPVHDPAARQVVRRQLHQYPVPGRIRMSCIASSRRCAPAHCMSISRAPPGTWRWGAVRSPFPRPRSRPSSASSGCSSSSEAVRTRPIARRNHLRTETACRV